MYVHKGEYQNKDVSYKDKFRKYSSVTDTYRSKHFDVGFLLLEDGCFLLQENGCKIILFDGDFKVGTPYKNKGENVVGQTDKYKHKGNVFSGGGIYSKKDILS